MVDRHTMKQSMSVIVAADDHATWVGRHDDAPFRLAERLVRSTRAKKTPSRRQLSHGGATVAIFHHPSRAMVNSRYRHALWESSVELTLSCVTCHKTVRE